MAQFQTKTSYNMARGIRASAPTVHQISTHMWIARGALRFPQGLQVIYNLFAGKHLAEAVSHPFFIEKEYWPEQPSPQFHLTEEIQSMMLVMKGITRMEDESTHLDNTMTLLRNPANEKEFALFNPIDVSNVTLKGIRKIVDGGSVTKIIIPTRQTWQSAGEWALQFPEAQILCSGNVPERFTKSGVSQANERLDQWKRDVKWEARMAELKQKEDAAEAEARQKEADRMSGKKPRPNLVRAPTRTRAIDTAEFRDSMIPTQFRRTGPQAATGFGVELPSESPFSFNAGDAKRETHVARRDKQREQAAVDMSRLGRSDLFTNESFADAISPSVRRQVVASDAPNGRTMYVPPAPGTKNAEGFTVSTGPPSQDNVDAMPLSKEAAPEDVAPNVSVLDPYTGLDIWGDGTAMLLHISGDKPTNEFVLYHHPSKSLCCSDLYHGPYTDFDPMNTWLCRVWFKLQRSGNYKSATTLPSYRRIHIEQHGDMNEMRSCVDDLTRAFPLANVCPAHGSVPMVEQPADCLRQMYDLPPLS